MKKLMISAVAAAMVSAGVLYAAGAFTAPTAPLAPAASTTSDDDAVFYGYMETSDTWSENGQTTLKYGIYSFTLDPMSTIDAASAVSTSAFVTYGGFYANGYYYYLNGNITSSAFSMTFNKMDVSNWTKVGSTSHSAPSKTVANDMTYDYTTSTAYAVSPNYNFDDNKVKLDGYALRTINLDSGEFTDVAKLQHKYTALAADANGQLWGIALSTSYPYAASLYKINKTNGAETLVGELGQNLKAQYSSATFDLRDNKLYWTALTFTYNEYYEERYVYALYEVDTKTGAASVAREFPTSETFSSLFMIDNNPAAPASASDLKFNFKSGSLTAGTLSMKLPITTYGSGTLSGKLSVNVLLDGKSVATASGLNPGATYTTPEINAANGKHTLSVIVTSQSNLSSLAAKLDYTAGADVPAAVTNIKLTPSKLYESATITWDAPTIGANGGYLDTKNLTYTIRRRPDNVEVVTGLKTTSFTDTPDRAMGVTQYEIIPVVGSTQGKSAYTNTEILGAPHTLPYLETFDTQTAFMGFTTIDVTNDGTENGNIWMYYAQNREAIWWMDYSQYKDADDWIISPAIGLESDKVYRLTFDTHGYSSAADGITTFNVYAGQQPTIEAMTEFIVSDTAPCLYQPRRILALFTVPFNGATRIGFHAQNNNKDHITLDNINITEYGTTAIAKAPAIDKAEKNDNGFIDFTIALPTEKVNGSKLSAIDVLMIYGNNNRVVAQVKNPAPGAKLNLTDKDPDNGMNYYVVLVETADGEGMEAYAEINVTPDKPKSVENVAVLSTGNEATITWNYPADMLGANGGKLREKDLTYTVTRQDGAVVAKDIKECKFVDTNAAAALNGKLQGSVTYTVVATTEGGSAYGVQGSGIVGQTLDLPLYETFSGSAAPLWSGVNYQANTQGYDPLVREGYDDNYLCSLFANGSVFRSPRINFSSLINPTLTFWLYKTNDTRYNNATVLLFIENVDENGVVSAPETLPEQFSTAADENGWVKCTVDLSKYAKYTRASLMFNLRTSKGRAHIDKIEITGERAENDIRVKGITGPKKCLAGRTNTYTVTIDNNGTKRAEDFTVEFVVDDKVLGTDKGSLDSGEETSFEFTYEPEITHPEVEKMIEARVTAKEEDYNLANNELALKVNIYTPDVPYITTLRAKSHEEHVELTWEDADAYPHSISITDDVESYSNFLISDIGNWKTIDGDGAPTLTAITGSLGEFKWTNGGKPQAFIVFNPSAAQVSSLADTHSGSRCFVSFVSSAGVNDDWLVSPLLLGAKQTISFWARAMHPSYLSEVVEIAVSSSGTDVDDFEEVVTRIRVNSTTWRRYEVELPAGSRYFAFHCLSAAQFGLMIDDIEYVPAQPPVELWGYNVYRNGERIATEHGENWYRDTEGEFGKPYEYNVSAVYSEGESKLSNTVTSGRNGIDQIGENDTDNILIAPAEGCVIVKGAEGKQLSVYTIDGIQLYGFRATAMEQLPLQPGIYVVKAGNKTAKVSIR